MSVVENTTTIFHAQCNYCNKFYLDYYDGYHVVEFNTIEELKDEIQIAEWDFFSADHICCRQCRQEQIEWGIAESRNE